MFTCSSMFQSLGNTMPALLSKVTRFICLILPAIWLSKQSDFQIEQLWYVSVASVCIQTLVSFSFLRHDFKKRLPGDNEQKDHFDDINESNGIS